MIFKIIATMFMATFFIVEIKETYEDILKLEQQEEKKISSVVVDTIILLLTIITMIRVWF